MEHKKTIDTEVDDRKRGNIEDDRFKRLNIFSLLVLAVLFLYSYYILKDYSNIYDVNSILLVFIIIPLVFVIIFLICIYRNSLISKIVQPVTFLALILLLSNFILLFFIPPAQVIIDPLQMTDSLQEKKSLNRTILLKNIGVNLKNLSINSTDNNIWNCTRIPQEYIELDKGSIYTYYINVNAATLNTGEYRGFIEIKANKSTILGESKSISIGKIPVVLNVSEPKSSPPEQTSRRDINISGNINITQV